MASLKMESVRDHEYDGIDPLASPSESSGSNATPDTEYSPPVSPLPKRRVLQDSRSAARKKLASLTLEEKVCVCYGSSQHRKLNVLQVSLLTAADFWRTKSIPKKGIPAIKTSDGPNGARGGIFVGGTKVRKRNSIS
jgi:beta-glucosidase